MLEPKFKSLYYPSYIPDRDWLKLQLLFWDQVQRIVPNQMQDKYGDNFIASNFNIDPILSPAISPEYDDLSYFDKHEASIRKAFIKIKKESEKPFDIYGNYWGVHPQKAPEWVFQNLEELGLARINEIEPDEWHEGHHLVHPDAGGLILSCLGSKLAKRHGFEPVTDHEFSFYITAANEINENQSDRSNITIEDTLGAMILKSLVPSRLDKIKFSDILKIREDYEELRIGFHKTIRNISETRLEKIVDKKRTEEELRACLSEYLEAYNKFFKIKERLKRIIKDWRTQAFGISIGALGAYFAGGPTESLYLGLGGASVSLMGVLTSEKVQSDEEKSCYYINAIRKYLEATNCIMGLRPFLVGCRFM